MLDGVVQDLERLILVDLAPEGHATQADGADADIALSKPAVFHMASVLETAQKTAEKIYHKVHKEKTERTQRKK